jgi:LysM repeat protein
MIPRLSLHNRVLLVILLLAPGAAIACGGDDPFARFTATATVAPAEPAEPTEPPAAVPASQTEPASDAATYVVEDGDTLSEIAAELGVSLEDLVEANDIEDADEIAEGQTLLIPSN